MFRKKGLWIHVFTFVLLFLFSFGYFNSGKCEELVLVDPMWKSGETHVFNLVAKGQLVGSSFYKIESKELKSNKVYGISVETKFGGVVDTVEITLEAMNLKPISTIKQITLSQGKMLVQATYLNNKKVNLSIKAPQGSQTMDLSLPENTFDNEGILMLLRAFDFEKRKEFKFNNFSPVAGQTYPCHIKVLQKEEIQVPAGIFKCFKLELNVAGQQQYLWYDESPAHYLVLYDNGQAKFELEKLY